MESEIDKLINLILENNLLFSIITTWRSLPVYYTIEGEDRIYRMNIELSEDDIEDCYLIVDAVTKKLQTYCGNFFYISVDFIVEFIRIHREIIEKAMTHDSNSEITVIINRNRYTVTIDRLCETLLNYASLSSDVRIVI